MSINKAGLALVKRFEGFRGKAYKCPAGVWTIGYGHTSKAGPPAVRPGMKITKTEAEDLLGHDLVKYELAVKGAVKVPINENQYAALVSFCYNIGPGGFRSSSALRYLNKGQHDKVPARMALWNKGGGRVLQGLVRRRRAEGDLFLEPATDVIRRTQDKEAEDARNTEITAEEGKPMSKSKTNWTAIGTGAAGGVSALAGLETPVALAVIAVIVLGVGYIIYERRQKSIQDGI